MAKPKGRVENLKPFKKGHDERRNLKGAPKKLPDLQELVADLFGSEDGNVSKANIRLVLDQQLKKAAKGDSRAAEIILNYAYGKPKQAHEHSGPDKGPIEVKQWIVEVEPEQPKPKDDPKNSSM